MIRLTTIDDVPVVVVVAAAHIVALEEVPARPAVGSSSARDRYCIVRVVSGDIWRVKDSTEWIAAEVERRSVAAVARDAMGVLGKLNKFGLLGG